MKNIKAVFCKQIKDTIKNRIILIQFLLFPIMTLIMNNAVKINDMPENFFTELFAVMYAGMAPIVTTAAIVSEEKEKGTLRALRMAGVKPLEYLFGIGSYVLLACMLGSVVMFLSGSYQAGIALPFLLIMALGIFISTLMGAAVGTASRSQMAATSLSVPLMMVFAFLPMIGMFNQTVEKIAEYTYTQQIQHLLSNGVCGTIETSGWFILAGNGILALFLFAFAYQKNGLE